MVKTSAERQDYTLPKTMPRELEEITRNHVESFNYFLDHGMDRILSDLGDVDLPLPHGERFQLSVNSIRIPPHSQSPYKARVSQTTYDAPFEAVINYKLASRGESIEAVIPLGRMPIMVKSTICKLYGMGPNALAQAREEPYDTGGYFIVNGIDKIIRLIIGQRQNYPFVIQRPNAVQKGENFSQFVSNMKSVARDGTSLRLHMHYTHTGNMVVGLLLSRRWFYIPLSLILKGLVDGVTDREIYEKLVQGRYDDGELKDVAERFIRAANSDVDKYRTQNECLQFLGPHFRQSFGYRVPSDATDITVAKFFLDNYVCIHCVDNRDKLECLLLMAAKLLNVVIGRNAVEDIDATTAHEMILPGQIIQAQFKAGLVNWLQGAVFEVKKKLEPLLQNPLPEESKAAAANKKNIDEILDKVLKKGYNLGGNLKYFLSTGNIKHVFGDSPQLSGWSIVGERINYFRYFSHYRSIHRGAFFTEMRTSTIRKLRPESWGFLCPVHTPDGSPIGLLNHLACLSRGVTEVCDTSSVPEVLVSLGMIPLGSMSFPHKRYLPVVLDGKLLGRIQDDKSQKFVDELRLMKIQGKSQEIPPTLEIVHFPSQEDSKSVFPGIFLFSKQGRFVRPVRHLGTDNLEYIGSLEQLCLQIACVADDVTKATTHQEFDPTNMLDILANLTPFCNNNQSPRNLYQCQMAKQTMGTPMYSYPYRFDNKIWRINTPQRPLARTHFQDVFDFDNYPAGTNACVAVISYTGYDMEDAMIINKSAYERGLGHGTVYKTEKIDLSEISPEPFYFEKDPRVDIDGIGADGLPVIGNRYKEGEPFYSYWNSTKGIYIVKPYKSAEPAYVDSVVILEKRNAQQLVNSIVIKWRFNRNPIIGDKFSSRHGQKGVLSQLWPQIDMPFTESGLTPDIIINPHAFPSRMTIGMLLESMAAKSGALHGSFQDATPFKFNEESTAVDHFGKELVKAGYNYYGNEPMYSGINGTELKADIYFGVVYYQRLRHMVSDKYQVRSIGSNNVVTGQPIKGRKKGGGVRFGEMERDSLIAHGSAFLLLDRLMNCSDSRAATVCSKCGGVLSVSNNFCIYCGSDEDLKQLNMPTVWRYLSAELAAMNIAASVVVQ